MHHILCDLFADRVAPDPLVRYKPDAVNVYFENRINGTLHTVKPDQNIKQITMDKK